MSCNCTSTLRNTGSTPGCVPVSKSTDKVIFVPLLASDGTRNGIDLADTFDEAFISALINQADKTKRWYPTPIIENVENVRAEPDMVTFDSGRSEVAGDGIRKFTFHITNQDYMYLGKIKAIGCSKSTGIGVYLIDKTGKLKGSISSDGLTVYPIAISLNTFYAMPIEPKYKEVPMIKISFEFAPTEQDENLWVISENDFEVDLLSLEGLYDLTAVGSLPIAASAVITVTLDFSTGKTPIKQTGLVKADFAAYNVTDAAAAPISTVEEISAGAYLVTYTTPVTVADVIRFTITKTGFETATCQVTTA